MSDERPIEFCDEFLTYPALSFSKQPNLRTLFERLMEPSTGDDRCFTFVLGAGISLDAGLPSWSRLISNIIEMLDPAWKSEAQLDRDDLIRKAESAVQLAVEAGTGTEAEIVRDALYRRSSGTINKSPRPGRLADAIARLCTWLDDRVQIVTTNYDTLFEQALQAYGTNVASVAFEDRDSKWTPGRSVLHLHGILVPNSRPAGNLVLTERHFLEYGPAIRDFLAEQFLKTDVVFVGLSLTDPNLIAPLWQLKDQQSARQRFILSVASPNPRSGLAHESVRYEIKKADFLRKVLSLRPIFFKSYGQQTQAICEASLAMLEEDQYIGNDDPTSSLRYGFRLMRTMKLIYRNLECADDSELPLGQSAQRLSDKLNSHLSEPTSPLNQVLNYARRQAKLRDSYKAFAKDFDDERFGLFLWLRSPSSMSADDSLYELRLVGTSVYQHRAEWSLDRKANVSNRSRFPVGQAAFKGQGARIDFPKGGNWQLWGCAYSVPFSYYDESTPYSYGQHVQALDAIDVGVLSIQSRHFMSRGDGQDWSETYRRSILSTIDAQTERKLEDELARIARVIVSEPLQS